MCGWTVTSKGISGPKPVVDYLLDGSFTFELAHLKTSKHCSTTAWDEALQFIRVQVWDPLLLFGPDAHPRKCPCGCSGKAGGQRLVLQHQTRQGHRWRGP